MIFFDFSSETDLYGRPAMILSASASVIPFTFIRSSLEAELMSGFVAAAWCVDVDLVVDDFAVVVVVVFAGAAAGVEAGGVDEPVCAIAANGTARAAATAGEESKVVRFIVFPLWRHKSRDTPRLRGGDRGSRRDPAPCSPTPLAQRRGPKAGFAEGRCSGGRGHAENTTRQGQVVGGASGVVWVIEIRGGSCVRSR